MDKKKSGHKDHQRSTKSTKDPWRAMRAVSTAPPEPGRDVPEILQRGRETFRGVDQ